MEFALGFSPGTCASAGFTTDKRPLSVIQKTAGDNSWAVDEQTSIPSKFDCCC